MLIKPLAFESFGVRSMCTFVETRSVRVLIDPGVSLAPYRFGLTPHPVELKALSDSWKIVLEYAGKADVILITHYHFDHFNPFEDTYIYEGKTVLVKHPKNNINFSQIKRSKFFLDKIHGLPERLEFADEREFKFGDTLIKFSSPVYHGTGPQLGYVLEVLFDDGYKMLYTSDVEGPATGEQLNFILGCEPNTVILDGPMTYMLGYRYSFESFEKSLQNILKIIENDRLEKIIIDHHALRDIEWRERLRSIFEFARNKNVLVLSAAEFAGLPVNLLEARRRELYEQLPVT
ncbi:MAG: MBL fold metallo-hydrolase [Candidatus Odinarchaeota archaeon]